MFSKMWKHYLFLLNPSTSMAAESYSSISDNLVSFDWCACGTRRSRSSLSVLLSHFWLNNRGFEVEQCANNGLPVPSLKVSMAKQRFESGLQDPRLTLSLLYHTGSPDCPLSQMVMISLFSYVSSVVTISLFAFYLPLPLSCYRFVEIRHWTIWHNLVCRNQAGKDFRSTYRDKRLNLGLSVYFVLYQWASPKMSCLPVFPQALIADCPQHMLLLYQVHIYSGRSNTCWSDMPQNYLGWNLVPLHMLASWQHVESNSSLQIWDAYWNVLVLIIL